MNHETGLFFFDSSYRPVPLAQQYIGISEPNFMARNKLLNDICYNKVFPLYGCSACDASILIVVDAVDSLCSMGHTFLRF